MGSIMNRPPALELAQRCKMGDLSAMEALAFRHLELCPPETRTLLVAYESQPNEENRRALHRHLSESQEGAAPCRGPYDAAASGGAVR